MLSSALEVAQLKMRDLMIRKEEGGKAIFLIEDFLLVLFILLHFLSWKIPKDIYRLKTKSKWGGADVTYRRDGILFLKQVF